MEKVTVQEAREALHAEFPNTKEMRDQIFYKELPDGRMLIKHPEWDVKAYKVDGKVEIGDKSWMD